MANVTFVIIRIPSRLRRLHIYDYIPIVDIVFLRFVLFFSIGNGDVFSSMYVTIYLIVYVHNSYVTHEHYILVNLLMYCLKDSESPFNTAVCFCVYKFILD